MHTGIGSTERRGPPDEFWYLMSTSVVPEEDCSGIGKPFKEDVGFTRGILKDLGDKSEISLIFLEW